MRKNNIGNSVGLSILGVVLVVALIGGVLFAPVIPTTIKSGEVAVVYNWGKISGKKEAGMTFRRIIGQKFITMKVSQDVLSGSYDVSTKDMQTVNTDVTIRFNLSTQDLEDIALNFGGDYVALIVEPTLSEAVNAATAQYTVEELVSQREALAQSITDLVTERLGVHGIRVTDVAITDHAFSAEYEKAVEQVKIAQQKTLEEKEQLEQAKVKAEANKLFAGAYTKENYAYEFLKKWDGKMPQVIGNEDVMISLMDGTSANKVLE